MNRRELADAALGGRIIWCGNCALVWMLSGKDMTNKAEIMRSGKCRLCGQVAWVHMTPELLVSDPRFRSLGKPI